MSSRYLKMFCKKGVLKTFAKLTGKYLCQNRYFEENTSSFEEHFPWLVLELLNGKLTLFKH